MTDLTQQLEDKKKELTEWEEDSYFPELTKELNIITIKKEIAILEQAIAEIKNIQSQENEKANDNIALLSTAPKGDVAKPESSRAINGDGNSPDTSNLLQKQRQDFIFLLEDLKEETTCIGCSKEYTYAFKTFRDIIDKKIEQLNQPKEKNK